jgi:hypothetical protein
MLYKDINSDAVATLISNDDLHKKGIALDQAYRVVKAFVF